jgi:hypothetical protein
VAALPQHPQGAKVRGPTRAANLAIVQFDSLAAVDLGSNSFHLQVGRVVDDQIYLLDSLRDPVRLGGGLTRDKRIDRATQLRAIEALARSATPAKFPPGGAGGRHQHAPRRENAPQFIEDAHAVLGFDRGDLRSRGGAPDLPRRCRAACRSRPARRLV